MDFLISTTGMQDPVTINDFGERSFAHPVTDYNLLTEFKIEEIRDSSDFGAALDAGYLTAKYKGYFITTSELLQIVLTNTITEDRAIAYIISQTMRASISEYTFDASAQTITFDSFQAIEQNKILLITNVTDSVILYNPFDISKGGSVSTNVLTLTFDTTAMSDTDDIQIIYDVPNPIILIDEASATISYVGKSRDGGPTNQAIWQIQRIDTTTGTEVKWADGNDKYDNVWDNRSSLSYS